MLQSPLPSLPHYPKPLLAIISTLNPDRSTNLSLSSTLPQPNNHCTLTLHPSSQTLANLLSSNQCVLSLPSEILAPAITPLIGTTGSKTFATLCGLKYVRAKFAEARLTPCRSEKSAPAGVAECAVKLEAEVGDMQPLLSPSVEGGVVVEMRVVRINADKLILKTGSESEVDGEIWRPLRLDNWERWLRIGEGRKLSDGSGQDDDSLDGLVAGMGNRSQRMQVEPPRKIKASRAGCATIVRSPSVTSLRAVFDEAGTVATDVLELRNLAEAGKGR
ncbi:MAG: hypothetical protein Q9182_003065 [Xanthomendoza sp. 2 TL-2023]